MITGRVGNHISTIVATNLIDYDYVSSWEQSFSLQMLSQNAPQLLGVYMDVMLCRPSYIKALIQHRPVYIARDIAEPIRS